MFYQRCFKNGYILNRKEKEEDKDRKKLAKLEQKRKEKIHSK